MVFIPSVETYCSVFSDVIKQFPVKSVNDSETVVLLGSTLSGYNSLYAVPLGDTTVVQSPNANGYGFQMVSQNVALVVAASVGDVVCATSGAK